MGSSTEEIRLVQKHNKRSTIEDLKRKGKFCDLESSTGPKLAESLICKLKVKSHQRQLRLKKELIKNIENDQDVTMYDSANGEAVLRSSMVIERRTIRAHKTPKYFDRIDHKFVPQITQNWKERLFQPRDTCNKQMISTDEILTMKLDHELEELHYLERDQVQRLTNTALPDSDLMKALKIYVEKRIDERVMHRFNKSLEQENFTKFIDETALLALAKYTEELVREYVTNDVVKAHTECISTKEELPEENSNDLPFTITEEYHGNEDRFPIFQRPAPIQSSKEVFHNHLLPAMQLSLAKKKEKST